MTFSKFEMTSPLANPPETAPVESVTVTGLCDISYEIVSLPAPPSSVSWPAPEMTVSLPDPAETTVPGGFAHSTITSSPVFGSLKTASFSSVTSRIPNARIPVMLENWPGAVSVRMETLRLKRARKPSASASTPSLGIAYWNSMSTWFVLPFGSSVMNHELPDLVPLAMENPSGRFTNLTTLAFQPAVGYSMSVDSRRADPPTSPALAGLSA